MGCGTSALMSENADIKAKVRPMIKRLDDVRRRRIIQKGSTPSKKELLACEDCDKTTNSDSLGSKSMPSEDSLDHGAAKIGRVVEEEKEEEEVKTIVECEIKKENTKQEGNHEKENTGNEAELEENDDDDGRCISPGSPSFRFYCVESIPQETENDLESHFDSPMKNLQTKSIEEHPVQALSDSSAELELHQRDSAATRHPKGKMNRKFRTVIHKGGQVKSFLHVKSCYNPACSGTHTHLLQEAAA
ncbi:hypothetical protein QQ045_002396 [Rhodiola kirilowii]